MIDVLVLGDANPDLVLRGDVVPRFGQAEQLLTTADLVIGGSGGILAHGLARLGTGVRLVAAVGSDSFADLLRERLAKTGVDVAGLLVTGPATGVTVVLSSGEDRAVLTFPGAIADLGVEHCLEAVDKAAADGARHVHVSSLFLLPNLAARLPEVLRRARSHEMSTSLDTNDDPARTWALAEGVLENVDLLMPNAGEACALAGVDDPVEAARVLSSRGPTVVVKLGAEGAVQVHPDGTVLRAAAPSTEVVDTTGAGDTLGAACLDGRLRGLADEECLRRAVLAGALSTLGVGGTAGQPTADELVEGGTR